MMIQVLLDDASAVDDVSIDDDSSGGGVALTPKSDDEEKGAADDDDNVDVDESNMSADDDDVGAPFPPIMHMQCTFVHNIIIDMLLHVCIILIDVQQILM